MADTASESSTVLTLPIGTTIKKPARKEGDVSKSQFTTVLDGTLFIVTIDDALLSTYVKGNTMLLPAGKLIKSQNAVLVGRGENYNIAKYVSIKDQPL